MLIPPSISFSCTFEYDQVKYNQTQNMFGMASIKAPIYVEKENRSSLDIIAVLDKSGSMSDKIELVKKSLLFMIDQMQARDRLGIVEFDANVSTTLKLTSMDNGGKKQAMNCVNNIKLGTTTNISGAIIEAFDILANRGGNISPTTSILLFTDGLPTVGVQQQDKIVNIVEKLYTKLNLQNTSFSNQTNVNNLINSFSNMSINSNNTSVFTFGFGEEHSANCLTEICKVGGGLYYYIKSEDEIPQAFSDCLGGLISVFAQNIVLKFKCISDRVLLKRILNSEYGFVKQEIILPNKEIHIKLKDLYYEENRDILFELELLAESCGIEKQQLLDIQLEYMNIEKIEKEALQCITHITRGEMTVGGNLTDNRLIDLQKNRLLQTEALQKAKALADSNQLDAARLIINTAINTITMSITSNDQYCQNLINELRECLNEMRTKDVYLTSGNKIMNMYWCSNVQQRSNHRTQNESIKSKSSAKAKYVHFSSNLK